MSDIIISHIEIIIFIGLIIVVGLLVVSLLRIGHLFKFFSQTKFHIISNATTNPITGEKSFQLNIYNRHMNDLRVSSLGYIYQKNNIDFFGKYLEDYEMKPTDKLMVLSRDYITLKLDHKVLKDLVNDINKGQSKVKMIYAYVIDTQGITSKVKAKETKRVIKQLLKQDRLDLRQEKIKSQQTYKLELQQAKKLKKQEKKLAKKDRQSKFWFKVKRMFLGKRK